MSLYHSRQLAVILSILAVTFLWGLVNLYRARAAGSPVTIPPAAAVYEIRGVGVREGFYGFSSVQRTCDVLKAAGVAKYDGQLPTARVPSGTKILLQTAPSSASAVAITDMAAAARLNFFLSLDINAASADELELIPGVGMQTARAIVAYREKHGRITDVAELGMVPGLGKKKLHALRDWVYVKQ